MDYLEVGGLLFTYLQIFYSFSVIDFCFSSFKVRQHNLCDVTYFVFAEMCFMD